MAELRPYNPTWRDKLAQVLMGDAPASPERQRLVEGLLGSSGIGSTGMGLVDFTPAGVPLAAQEAAQAGDARGAVMAVVPPMKYAGPMASKAAGTIDELTQALVGKYPGVKLDISGRAGKPLVVNKVIVPEDMRGQGVGTSVMKEILDFADGSGTTVALTPSASYGGNKKRLEKWYSSLGFARNTGRNADYEISEAMYRLPAVKPDGAP